MISSEDQLPVTPASGQSKSNAPRIHAIHGVFFLSGVGALVLENVWFNQTGLIVGNSVWSAALVIGAFMAGLALGNGVAVVLARHWGNLVRCYAAAEIVAALSGLALVMAFPYLPGTFRPLLAPFLDDTVTLNLIRSAIAFILMVIPAAALGATLPLLSKPLESATGSYGMALGRLYGVNTIGAVAGTLLAELVLVPLLGLRGSGLFAAGCNLCAALIALQLAASPVFQGTPSAAVRPAAQFGTDRKRILAAAFLAGGILLALEVIWFRFLLLFQAGTTLIFAMMLAVVLAGIGIGGMLASRWSRHGWSSGGVARVAAAGAAMAVVAGYAGFDAVRMFLTGMQAQPMTLAVLTSILLMGPASLFSGVLFTALGDHLRERMEDAAATTGMLTLANTLGGVAGSLLAAFAFLPYFGLEGSFFLLSVLYWVMVIVIPRQGGARKWRLAPLVAAGLMLVLFPFGTMIKTHYHRMEERYGERLVAAREGIVETAFYLAHDFLGEPLYYRLATNAFSMSATSIYAQRYMKLFAYLPAAFHPRVERALVICFGVGTTAGALTDLPDVKEIDVVDVSRDILEMSVVAHPDVRHHPLRDRRVKVHIEDGRFFLQQTDKRYDLITGEPPPPKIAGMASLYSREYFQLLHDHLNPGGLATYWLPAHQLREPDTLAIISAFCAAFDDCSLWSGVGLEWILMGSRGGIPPVSREQFSRLWTLPQTAKELRRIGIETPVQLVAQFMADAALLKRMTHDVAPLVDNFPRRISSQLATKRAEPLFAWLMNAGRSRERLEGSPQMAAILPRPLIAGSAERFHQRGMLDVVFHPETREPGSSLWSDLAQLVRETDLVTLPRWLLDSEAGMAEIAMHHDRGDPVAAEQLAIDAMANRRPPTGRNEPPRFDAMTAKGQVVTLFRHCLAGQQDTARSLAASIAPETRAQEPFRSFLSWARKECALDG